ncbi:MAG: GntR family transcriptional regulator [Kiritimatiellaeota bacterium]|nr:GntR family transcriptional regulator [Kiritimatiellota bacterium]
MIENNKNYHWIAERFRKKIATHEWGLMEKISTERALSREFGVTRVTIRRALRLLEAEGLIRRKQGSGTYVNPNRTHRIPLMIDYAGSMSDHVPGLKRKLISKEIAGASESLAADLNIKNGAPVLLALRVDFSPEEFVAYDRVFIPEEFAVDLTDSLLATVNFLEVWSEACDFKVVSCRQTIEAVVADDSSREYLGVETGAPVLKSTESYYAESNLVAGMFVSYYHPEHICISSNYNWSQLGK